MKLCQGCQEVESVCFLLCGHHFCQDCAIAIGPDCRSPRCADIIRRPQPILPAEEYRRTYTKLELKIQHQELNEICRIEALEREYHCKLEAIRKESRANLDKTAQELKAVEEKLAIAEILEDTKDSPLAADLRETYNRLECDIFYIANTPKLPVAKYESRLRIEKVYNFYRMVFDHSDSKPPATRSFGNASVLSSVKLRIIGAKADEVAVMIPYYCDQDLFASRGEKFHRYDLGPGDMMTSAHKKAQYLGFQINEPLSFSEGVYFADIKGQDGKDRRITIVPDPLHSSTVEASTSKASISFYYVEFTDGRGTYELTIPR